MGVAKSLRKAGHFGSLRDNLTGIANILEENRKKEEQKKFYENVVGLFGKWEQGQEKAGRTTDLKEEGQVNNVLSPENLTGITGKKPTGLNLNVNVPENIQSQLSSTPQIPETQTREIAPKERYQRGQENLSEFVNAIAPMIMNPNIDDASLSRVNVLSSLAQQQAEGLKPKTGTVSARDPFQKYVERDEFGEEKVIQEAGTKPIKIDLEGSYKNPKTGTYWKYDETNRAGVDTFIPYDKGEGRTTVNINNPEEKSLKESTAKLIADLKNFKPYTINDDGAKVPMLPEDIKYQKDNTLENIKLQLLSPRGYEFINNIEQLWKAGDPSGGTQYLSPKQLYDEAIKHAEIENIPEEVQDEIATYLRYYSEDIYKGLTTNANK